MAVDKKMITYIINVYFTILIWFFLMIIIFQISNEVPLINFLILSLFYFFFEVCKGLAYYKVLKIGMSKLKKKEKTERLKKANRNFKIINAIVYAYIFITLALYCVYVGYFIKKTSFSIIFLTLILFTLLIIYNIVNQFIHKN